MQTNVFANEREICSKGADGKSVAAFPDVCWSPPGPPVGPIPLPYPNTALASDLADGSSTVLVCDEPIALKNQSYFAKSTGNQPATQQFAKGLASGVLEGKAYFASWSMNVKAEGLNVTRHMDLMTHNHGSQPANTPPYLYMAYADKGLRAVCANDLKKVEKECEPEKDEPNKKKSPRALKRSFLKKLRERTKAFEGKIRNKGKGFKPDDANAWMDDHCAGLWLKPSVTHFKEDVDKYAGQLQDMAKDMDQVVNTLVKPMVETLTQEIIEKIAWEAAKKGAKMGLRAGARWGVGAAGLAAGGVGVIVTEVVATAWNIWDLVSTGYDVYVFGQEMYKQIDEISAIMGDYDKALNEMNNLWETAKTNPTATMSSGMEAMARLNACTRARRCLLVAYSDTGTVASFSGKGCCPGQTGHHLLPDEMTKNNNCPGYNKRTAPVLCVEGVNNSHGSHGKIHRKLAALLKNRGKTISYDKARDIAVESVQATFPESGCDTKCLKAQLDAYYKNKCTKPLPPLAGMPGTLIDADEDGAE